MAQQYYGNNEHHPMRAALGFIMTMIMTLLLISSGTLTALSVSVLKGNDLNSILKNAGFYDTLRSTVITELSSERLSLSEDAIDTVFPDEIMSKTVDKITDSLVNGTPFDISYIESDCMDIAKTTSDALISEAYDVIDTHPTIDVKTIADIPALAEFEDDFNVDVSSKLESSMMSAFGSTTVDISAVGSDEVKKQVSDTVSDLVDKTVKYTFDNYSSVANDLANDLIRKANNEYKLDTMFKEFDKGLSLFHSAIIILYVIAIALFIIQLLMYIRTPSGAFKNLSVCAVISALSMFILSGCLSFITDSVLKKLDSFNRAEQLIKDFIEAGISSINKGIITVGIIFTVVAVISIIITVVTKNLSRKAYTL